MRTYHGIVTSFALVGLYGCDDVALPPSDAPVLRNVGYVGPPEEGCLADSEIKLFHDDGTADAAQDIAEGLAKYARPNDVIEVSLSALPGCIEKYGTRLSLVAYTSPGIVKYGLKPGEPARAYDMHTARFDAKQVGTLKVQLPDCFFRVELAFGEPRPRLDGHEPAEHVLASTQGGESSCDPSTRLEITAFDTVERGWGDAPLLTHFGWGTKAGDPDGGVNSEKPPVLTCELDFEGDGAVDQVISPCPRETSDLKVAALPAHSFTAPGEHRPELVVSDGKRRLWAGTTVHANKLDYRPEVRFPEQVPNFLGGTLTAAPAPALSKVVLQYSGLKQVPAVKVGDVVVGTRVGGGYMLRATKVAKTYTSLTVTGTLVGLDETIAGGYFGVRDVALATDAMHCHKPPCLGTLTTSEAPPPGLGAPEPVQLAFGMPALDMAEEEQKFGWKITVPLADGQSEGVGSEAEIFGGIVVKKFAIDGLIVGDLTVDIDIAPTIETAVAVKAEISDSLELGDWWVGALPTPIPITVTLSPRIDFSSAFKFAGKFALALPFQLVRNQSGWDHRFAPQISGDAYLLDGGAATEASLESKFTLVPEIGFSLGPVDGPYVAPVGSLGVKASANFDSCDFCMTVFAEAGGEVGWHGPWWLGEILEPIQVIIGEFELKKACETMPPPCDPPPPPPGGGGGGSWGDVHVISHDGLLFDFQAGGEFVLARATAGAPFQVQARQEPIGDQLSLSYNTAIATEIGGEKVGIYARHTPPLYKKDGFVDLLPGTSVAPAGGGLIARQADGRYLLTYLSGETVRVDVVGAGDYAHLNVAMSLPPGRANQVEGVLGDADGVTANDIDLGGGAFMPQPVTFDQLYRGAASFTEKWRVAQSLFVYTDGQTADTFRVQPYSKMPLSTPPNDPQHQALAATECAACPELLRDTCMLDVAFTGEAAFADACQDAPGTPGAVLIPADDFVAVSPRYGAPIDCDDPKVVFRGPGIANADQYPQGMDLAVVIGGFVDTYYTADTLEHLYTFVAPPGGASNWGEKFECHSLGGDDSWGECTFHLDPNIGPCAEDSHPYYYWSAFTVLSQPDYDDMAYFSLP